MADREREAKRALVEPMWAWQVFDNDNRWGTIAMVVGKPALGFLGKGNVESGHNLVLMNRNERIVRESMREWAEMHHRMTGMPVRLHRFIADPNFEPEEL